MRRPDVPLVGTLEVPVVCAPMAGGPSTPALVSAVCEAGGSAFVAGGYRTGVQLADDLAAVRTRTDRPFGVNVFLPTAPTADLGAVLAYRDRLAPLAARHGIVLGEPRWDDDDLEATLEAVAGVPLVSTTFGCPAPEVVDRLHSAGSAVAVTVSSAAEARQADAAGVDLLVVQGDEAGGHRGSWTAHEVERPAAGTPVVGPSSRGPAPGERGGVAALSTLLPAVRAVTDLPLWAAGGLMDGTDVAAALDAGAAAAVLGTAFLACPEAGTSAVHRAALLDARFDRTVVSRAFTGRPARGLLNAFTAEYGAAAPPAFPEVHAVTRPLRQDAARRGDPDLLHLWAGTGWRRLRPLPAADLVRVLAEELAAARGDGHRTGEV